MSDGLKVDFAEIDRMVTGLTNLNAYALPLVPKVGALSADGDLLASAILSPGTAVAAEGAVLSASAQLGVTMVTTEALVLITASIVKVYEAAEVALALSAAALEVAGAVASQQIQAGLVHAGDAVLGYFTSASTAATVVVLAVGSFAQGLGQNLELSAAVSLAAAFAQTDSPLDLVNGDFARHLAAAWDENFSWSDAFSDVTRTFESNLGAVPGGYDALMFLVLHDGRSLGFFNDGRFDKHDVDQKSMKKSADKTVDDLDASIPEIAEGLDIDPTTGAIKPHSIADVFAGAAQIDNIGKKDFADIRIVERKVGEESYFTVQIPSTQRWAPWGLGNPWGQGAPNDLTSDVLALQQGDQTALAEAVKQAMRDAKVGNHPVMLTGFSLGGITAGAIAQGNNGEFNIQQVVTAGAPIARMDIPADVHVTALESTQDAVPTLDGKANPSAWSVSPTPETARLDNESAGTVMSPKNVHDAARYAQMADNYSSKIDPGVSQFLEDSHGATMTVKDVQVVRR
ncbi:hypothetical protein BIU98_12620 [Curtobacterium sp. MMLR14_010]|uniref:hypothetical protein n=1 Tax=Curtobacterium sp. MMLR14_010 TaxID=1898743 RepID=UPI0008DE0D3B|nr:hypothetical protein [Curtobacterium sp. MMLR14_010]OII38982.1 hypothetical protein BIU98_12620 [Curtobacterium sp. MMLR14_010]